MDIFYDEFDDEDGFYDDDEDGFPANSHQSYSYLVLFDSELKQTIN